MDTKLYNFILQHIQSLKYDKDIKTFHYSFLEGVKLLPKDSKVKVGLINVPCAGFGDIINCKTFSEYLKSWYPNMKIDLRKKQKHEALADIQESIEELQWYRSNIFIND